MQRYQRLHAAGGNRVPFAMHEWHVAWVRHFLNSNPRILDQPFFNVARNSNGECVGIIPFIISRRNVGPREVEYKSAYQQCGRLRSRMAQQAYIRARSGGGLQGWVLQHLVPARRNWR